MPRIILGAAIVLAAQQRFCGAAPLVTSHGVAPFRRPAAALIGVVQDRNSIRGEGLFLWDDHNYNMHACGATTIML